jgi:hypothetical protein
MSPGDRATLVVMGFFALLDLAAVLLVVVVVRTLLASGDRKHSAIARPSGSGPRRPLPPLGWRRSARSGSASSTSPSGGSRNTRATGLSAVGELLGEISLEPLNTFGELQLRDQRSHETRGLAAATTHRLRKRKRAAMDARVCRVGPGPDGPP